MFKYNNIKYESIVSFLIKLSILVSLFFPFEIKKGSYNDIFILNNFVVSLIFIFCNFSKSNKRDKNVNSMFLVIYSILILIYNILFFIYNLYYHAYFIEQVNKTISFIYLIVLIKNIDNNFIKKHRIIEFLICSIVLTSILSIISFILGVDAITIKNFNISIRMRGMFGDDRLTWIFGHKSSYGLLLLLFLGIMIKYRNCFKNKVIFFLSVALNSVTIIFTSSSTAIALMVLVIMCAILANYNFKKRYYLIIILLPMFLILFYYVSIFVYQYVSENRDLSNMGMRTYIYQAADYYINLYPNGIGKEFGDFEFSAGGMIVNNLHNIFFNEAIRFSIPVGITYFIIFIWITIYSISKNNKLFSLSIWISCFVLFFMDYALRTDLLSLFIFLVYLLFFNRDMDNTIKI